MTYESLYYATNNMTAASTIQSFGILAFLLVFAYFFYGFVRAWNERCKIWMKADHNKIYLDDLCTSYKAGYIKQKAREEGITLEDVPEPKRRTIADKLKEDVDKEIAT